MKSDGWQQLMPICMQLMSNNKNRIQQMLFSFKEFEETKNLIIKQFGEQPSLELASDDTQTIYQYQKLLNQIKHQKNVDHAYFGRSTKSMAKLQKKFTAPQSASSRRFVKENKSNLCQTISSDRFAKSKDQESRLNSANRLSNEDRQSNFYLTTINQNDSYGSLKVLDLREHNQISQFSKTNKEEGLEQHETVEAKELLNLRISIIQFENQQKYLITQISQLEQSIRYFRCLNNEIQHKIHQRQKKYLVQLNLALKKQSVLNSANSRNKYFEEKLESTQNFFTKSLKSIKLNRKSENRKCQEMIDDVTQKILTMKYLKKQIEQQKLHIAKLDQKNRYKSKRIQDNKNMQSYASILLKIQSVANFIKHNSYGKINQLANLNQSLSQGEKETNFAPLGAEENVSKQQINFLQLTKEVLKVYFKLLSDEQRLEQNYDYKINEMASNRKIQSQDTDSTQFSYETHEIKRNQSAKMPVKISKFFTEPKRSQNQAGKTSHDLKQSKARQLINEQTKLDRGLAEAQIKKQQRNAKKINERLLLMEQKSRFFIKKCIKYLEHVVQKWLKFDQSAINFVVEATNKFILVDSKVKKQMSECINKDILKDYFENWDKYGFFIEEFSNNPIINTFSSKDFLTSILRRIIKTKCSYTHVPTQRIFVKYLKKMHNEKVAQIFENINNLLRIAVEIIQYSSKFQVFIVNNFEKEDGEGETEHNQKNKNYSLHTSNKVEMQKNEKKDFNSNRMKDQKVESNKDENEDELLSDGEDGDELEEQKRRLRPVSQAHTMVNLIMAYQSEINKISKISRKHRQQ